MNCNMCCNIHTHTHVFFQEALISANTAKNFFFTTDLLKFYMELGIEIETIHEFIEYKPTDAVAKFVDTVTQKRKEGDANELLKLIADTFKLTGNSCYGE